MNVENLLESKIRELQAKEVTSDDFKDLYKDISNERLKTIFSWLHGGFINLFNKLNERLPTGENEAYFWAEPSRGLIFLIDLTTSLQSSLKKTELAFSIDNYYEYIITTCSSFLSESRGSTIPPHMDKVELSYLEPIFYLEIS